MLRSQTLDELEHLLVNEPMAFAFSLNVGFFGKDKSVSRSKQFDIKMLDYNTDQMPTLFNYEISINQNSKIKNLVSRHSLASEMLMEICLSESYSKKDYFFHFNQ